MRTTRAYLTWLAVLFGPWLVIFGIVELVR